MGCCKTAIRGSLIVCILAFVLACESENRTDDEDPREGKAYYTVRLVDQTPVDQLSSATPGADIDAVALIKFDDSEYFGKPIYADTVLDNQLGPVSPFAGLQDPELATGAPDWPDAECVADDVRFYGMGGHAGHLVVSFGNHIIEQGDLVLIYECANGPYVESYNVAVGASGDGRDPSFLEIGYDASGIHEYKVPELPALPAQPGVDAGAE